MTTDANWVGSMPERYDTNLGPALFAPFGDELARRAAALSPGRVLELAAGTGLATRALVRALPAASITATDLNSAMVRWAAERIPGPTWLTADAQELVFPDASFDVVVCQFGAMFFPDRPSGYREAKRVLKPGGTFLFSVWDRIEENVFADDVTNALATFFPDDPPRFLARTPHGYHNVEVIRSDLAKAGFSDVTIETRATVSRAASALHAATAYCQGTPLCNEIEARGADRLQAATDYAAAVIAQRHGSGEVAAKIQAHVIVARKDHRLPDLG